MIQTNSLPARISLNRRAANAQGDSWCDSSRRHPASYGYVVVGFDAPYRTATVVLPSGEVVYRPETLNPETMNAQQAERLLAALQDAWAADMAYVIDRLQAPDRSTSPLAGRMDLNNIVVVGHSLGGASGAQFCNADLRCRGSIDIDGALHGSVLTSGVRKPIVFLASDHGTALGPDDERIAAQISTLIRAVAGPSLDVRAGLATTVDIARRCCDVILRGGDPAILDS